MAVVTTATVTNQIIRASPECVDSNAETVNHTVHSAHLLSSHDTSRVGTRDRRQRWWSGQQRVPQHLEAHAQGRCMLAHGGEVLLVKQAHH